MGEEAVATIPPPPPPPRSRSVVERHWGRGGKKFGEVFWGRQLELRTVYASGAVRKPRPLYFLIGPYR